MNELISLDKRTGVDVSGKMNLDEVLESAGFNFDIESVPCHSPEGGEVPGKFLVRRVDSQHVFGVVGKRYNVIPVEKMMEPFHRMVTQFGASYETAGLIGGGKKCWISAKLPDSMKLKNRPEDVISQRILCLMNNDGGGSNTYLSIANRLFCNNQLSLIKNRAQKSKYKVGHVGDWEDQLTDVQLGFEGVIALHKEFEYTANKLNSIKMSESEMRGFAVQLFPEQRYDYQNKVKDKEKIQKSLTRLNVKREAVVELFSRGAGNLGMTRWDALNAVTEFQDHHHQISRVNNEKTGAVHAEKRFVNNVINGTGRRLKERAVDVLLNQKKFKKVETFA